MIFMKMPWKRKAKGKLNKEWLTPPLSLEKIMKLELTKAQVDHLNYILGEDLKETSELHYSDNQYVDRRYTRNSLTNTTNIINKLNGNAK